MSSFIYSPQGKRMKKLVLWIAVLLSLVMAGAMSGVETRAATFDDINQSGIFVKQNTSITCTLASATMMVRRAALASGNSNWRNITEQSMRSTAWIEGSGLRYSFTYAGITVNHANLSGGAANVNQLKSLLSAHPEGIVIFDWNVPHAILITDYTNNTFYCADPANNVASGRIPVSAASISINNADAYWYVSSPKITIGGNTSHDPVGTVDSASATAGKITVRGWAFDLDAPTTSIGVHAYVGAPAGASGTEGHALTANKSRPDVGNAYSSYNVGNNHGFADTFTTNKTGTQTVYFYAINTGGGSNKMIGTKTVTIPKDTTKPVISNVKVTNITNNGYTVTCNVSDNVGIKEVKFPTWTARSAAASDQDDLIWHVGKVSGNTASYTVKTSEHKNEKDISYITHIYAYDNAGNVANYNISGIYIDGTGPVISNAKITNVSKSGFDVSCKVTDRSPITEVRFPTWTAKDNQDDLDRSWQTSEASKGSITGNTATFHVNTEDHNNETGMYHVHVYAYDSFQNSSTIALMAYIGEKGDEGETPRMTKTWNGHTYKLFDFKRVDGVKLLWNEANTYCQSIGGHLVTISSPEENQIVKELVSSSKESCWIGATDEENEGTFVWATGETFSYTNWRSGDPNNTSGDNPPLPENYAGMETDGSWIDYTTKRYKPFVCEFDVSDTDITTLEVILAENTYIFDGNEKTPAVSIKKGDTLLSAGSDYRVIYSDNINAGTAKARIEGVGAYTGTVEKLYTIRKAPGEIMASVENRELVVGDRETITVTANGSVHYMSDNEQVATVDSKGEITAKGAGHAEIMVSSEGDGNYEEAMCFISLDVKDPAKDISSCNILLEKDKYDYDGEEKEPEVVVIDGTKALVLNEDYYVTYIDNINAGTGKVTVEGISGYAGSVEKTFTIGKADQEHYAYLYDERVTAGEGTTIWTFGTGKVTYSSSDENVATVDRYGAVNALSEGSVTITVTFAGDTNYNEAADSLYLMVDPAEDQGEDHTHSYTYTVTKTATCEADGIGTYICEECGESYTKTLPATGHKWDEGKETKAPSCTDEGVMTYTCTECQKTRNDGIAALGHDEVEDKAVDPTCMSVGYSTGSHCSRCTIVIKEREELPKLDHHWGEPMIVREGNCMEHGKAIVICDVCSQAKMIETEFGDHTYGEPIVIKEATCSEPGKQISICEDCQVSRFEDIPAKGHTIVADPAVAPTETSTGLTKGSHCSVCGTVIKKQEIIPKKAKTTEETGIKMTSDPQHPAVEEKEKEIINQKNDGDPKGSAYGTLCARVVKSAKTSNTLGWNKVKGASGYIIYGNRCGTAYRYVKIANVKGTRYVHKGLKKGTYYKYLVVAYKKVSGTGTVITTSKTMHAATTGGKVGNCKKLKLNRTKVTLKRKKTFKIKAREVAVSKKMKIKRHRKVAFESSNPKIATVTKAGKIKALKKGSCKIYVYAQNGVYKTVTVKVK